MGGWRHLNIVHSLKCREEKNTCVYIQATSRYELECAQPVV